jgi:hypothetical protein
MHLKNIPPALVPYKHTGELGKLSKAALMDMVWSLAAQLTECCDDERQVIHVIWREWQTVEQHRKEFKKLCDKPPEFKSCAGVPPVNPEEISD